MATKKYQPNPDRLVRAFTDLVKIDSLSKEEAAVAEYLTQALKPLGAEIWQDDAGKKISGNCGNLHVRMKGTVPNVPAILFSAHLDTVTPGKGIDPHIENGIIRSDGTTILGADDKAGVAAILEVLRVVYEQKMPCGPIEVVFDVAEEIGLLGAREIDFSTIKAKCAFVLDGENMDKIVIRAPYANRMTYTIEGVAAHAGMVPERGISAIEVAAKAISKMRLGRLDPQSTANIGTIEGGHASNVVTPKVTMKAETRSHNLDTLEKQTEHMDECFKSVLPEFRREIDGHIIEPKFHATVAREYKAMNISQDSLPYRLAFEAGKQLGLAMEPESIGGGTNANIYNANGLPSVVLGTGMKEEHTTNEHLAVADLEMCSRFCLEILLQNAKQAT
ncbi:M20/M25/M40 family metallo-hydrolase [bacterium]|nr:M20/M25/M40 family metallo-hydrolase [bacterium]